MYKLCEGTMTSGLDTTQKEAKKKNRVIIEWY